MNRALKDVAIEPDQRPQAQWIEVSPQVYQRECIGQEHSASYNQNIADGHTELTIAVTFSINVSVQELKDRAANAWVACRTLHPESAVELSTDLSIPQRMTYRLFNKEQEISSWLDQTFVVVEGQGGQNALAQETVEMTYNRRLPSRGKQSMMYLVPDVRTSIRDSEKQHCIVWNVSHAVTDAYSIIQFINTYLAEVARGIQTIPASVTPEFSSIAKYLPISPLISYESLYKPSMREKEESLAQAKEQLELYKGKLGESIAMYPEADYNQREHHTHCLVTKFPLQDSVRILQALKEASVGITYAGAAATILATFQLYGRGDEKGALLGMTRNARRWVATVLPATGRVAIPMATDVVFLWIPFDVSLLSSRRQKESILVLGKEIKTQLKRHLLSPHYLSAVPYMSGIFVDGLKAQEESRASGRNEPELVGPSSPGFSSQGALELKQKFKEGDVLLTRHDLIHTGRQVGTSPWIGMFSLDACLKFSIGFDSKYYRPEKMNKFLNLVRENVASLSQVDTAHVESKL